MEKLDIYDENRNKTGKQIVRGTPLQPGEYFSVIHVCIFNSDNQLLIQQRALEKTSWPGLYDVSVGGLVSAGESSREAAIREIEEELGYNAGLIDKRPHFTFYFSKGFDDFYIMKDDIKLSELTLQKEEVRKVEWADKKRIEDLKNAGKFINYRASLIDMIFSMQDSRGAQT